MPNYVCYHLHTDDSMLDSCTNYKLYVDYAKKLGQKAICFTEHGNIYNWFQKKMYCEANNIKYLHGCEVYLTERFCDESDPEDRNIRDNYHTILIAKNYAGVVELNNLVALSTRRDHRYYKNRLSFEEFFGISDNIIKISACVQSPLNKFKKKAVERGKTKEDLAVLKRLLMHYDYYEIQYHNMPEQIEYNQYLYKMSQKFGKPLIAATDTHSLNQYKAECRTILQYGKTDGEWGDDENSCDLTYKTYQELVDCFKVQNSLPMDVVLEAIENTNRMADSVEEFTIDRRDKYPILYGEKDEEKLWSVLRNNFEDKINRSYITDDINNAKYLCIDGQNLPGYQNVTSPYVKQIHEEMRVFKKINMIGFMLFMSEIMSWAKGQHIATGFARGSVAGSTVAYMSNITDVDPIKWHTVFSRFANENRVEAGDIDVDFFEDDRGLIYDYIINRFGKEKTAYILAVGTLADKAVIDTIGKAFRVQAKKNNTETQYTIDFIKDVKQEFEANPDETRKKYPDLFYYYDGLVNCIVSQSQHPAGILVAPVNLTDLCGMFYGEDGQEIVPIDMEECHDMGCIKFDILGLKSVGVIDKTYKMLGKYFPSTAEINWNDDEVFNDIASDHTAIFQFESDYSGDCLKKFAPKSVEDLSIVNACIRPSGETYRDELLARHIHKNPSDIIDDLLKENLGYLIYQEDTIAFLQNICGFDGSDADSIRRSIGKKDKQKIEAALPKIMDGYCSKSDKPRDIAEREAKEFLNVIESSSSYQFGKNHSMAYSMLSYVMGYLRHYYPVQFCTAFLNCAKNDDDIQNGTALAVSRGCKVVKPKFRFSTSEYQCDPDTKEIYKGLASIKYLSESTSDKLYTLRDKEYSCFTELLNDIMNIGVNVRELDILIKLDFFSEFGNPNELMRQLQIYNNVAGRKQFKIADLDKLNIPLWLIQKHAGKATEKLFKDVDTKALVEDLINTSESLRTSKIELIKYEQECLGYICTTMKVSDDCYYAVSTNKYGSFWDMYQLATGNTERIKFAPNVRKLISVGKIVQINKIEPKNKVKLIDGKWVEQDETEEVVTKITLLNTT